MPFILQPAGYIGNLGRNTLTGPGIQNVDFSLFRNLRFTERLAGQVRLELFNALNHVNLGLPNTGLGTPTTGKILAAGDARQMQLGLKFIF